MIEKLEPGSNLANFTLPRVGGGIVQVLLVNAKAGSSSSFMVAGIVCCRSDSLIK